MTTRDPRVQRFAEFVADLYNRGHTSILEFFRLEEPQDHARTPKRTRKVNPPRRKAKRRTPNGGLKHLKGFDKVP